MNLFGPSDPPGQADKSFTMTEDELLRHCDGIPLEWLPWFANATSAANTVAIESQLRQTWNDVQPLKNVRWNTASFGFAAAGLSALGAWILLVVPVIYRPVAITGIRGAVAANDAAKAHFKGLVDEARTMEADNPQRGTLNSPSHPDR
jgi:hypothetical protein